MIKRQKRLIIIIAAVFAVLLAGYFIFIAPMLRDAGKQETTPPPELLPGEVLGTDNRILLFAQTERNDISSIEVHNSYEDFTFYKDEDDNFYIRGREGAPYDSTALASLITSAGYTLSLYRVTEDCDDFAEYGLDSASSPAYFILTTTSGTSHKVYIGDRMPSGNGYYCRYDGRDAVYVLDSTIADTLLVPSTALIMPILGYTLPAADYFAVTDFSVVHRGEETIHIGYTPDTATLTDRPSASVFTMTVPKGYIVNEENFYPVLQLFQNFQGDQVLEYNGYGSPIAEETLAAYGLDNPEYTLRYVYKGIESVIRFTPAESTGYYFAYSELFCLVALVPESTVSFLSWDTIMYVSGTVFMRNIDDIALVEVESPEVSEKFRLHGSGKELAVTIMSSGAALPATQITNFRQFYKTMLTVKLLDYTDSTEEDELLLTVRFTTDDGYVFEYKYYGYSTRRCFLTVNGEGEFYVLRDITDKIISDTRKLVNGDDIDSWAKN